MPQCVLASPATLGLIAARFLIQRKPGSTERMLLLIGLEQLSIGTSFCFHSGGQDCPAMGVSGQHMGFDLDPEAIADGILGQRGLGGAPSLRAFLPLRDRFHPIVQGMVTPGPRLAPSPPLPTPFVLRNSRLGIGGIRKPAGFDTLDVLCDTRGFFRLSCGIGF